MDNVHFLFGVHNHQPIGNFDFVFEKAYRQAYLPFLEVMERHPKIRWNLHATGILWEWLEKHYPTYVDRLGRQVAEDRLELLTGGYYEPILPILPAADQIGQIQKLTLYIQRRFGVTPKGMWLAERVWEPHLAKVLHDAGVTYTLVDDTHFLSTGMPMDELTGAFATEEQGAAIRLLPIRKDLRYAIPFKDPGETLTLLRRFMTPFGYHALVMMDDGEKFGLWPDTYKHVYQDGWLDRFFSVLESNTDWLRCSRISDYLADIPSHGRVYLPTVSYDEMSEWSLPPQAQDVYEQLLQTLPPGKNGDDPKRFVRGGFWRNFFTKYAESNNLHKKMIFVSEKVHQAASEMSRSRQRGVQKIQPMQDALWAGQCNCAYWHGVFGGLYLPHLRQAIYRQLLEAENLADKALKKQAPSLIEKDFDLDGRPEVLYQSPAQNLYIHPQDGGTIFEWDLRERQINLLNVLTRRSEGYHKKLLASPALAAHGADGGVRTIHDRVRVKEPGLEKRLFVDWYRRTSLIDHFLHPETRIEDFYQCHYGEQGDFVKSGYFWEMIRGEQPAVRLSRVGSVWKGHERNGVRIEKTLKFPIGW